MKRLNYYTTSLIIKIILVILSGTGLLHDSMAQTPFICKGQSFITYKVGSSNMIAQLKMKDAGGTVDVKYLGNLKTIINCIGYRSTDNLIYGFNPDSRHLIRIDSNNQAKKLQHYELPKYQNYLAGDVTPDGRYFVMIGGDPLQYNGFDRDFIVIDLTDSTYPIVKKIDITDNNTRIFDIAFDPVTEILYGYDTRNNRLVTISMETGKLTKTFPMMIGNWVLGALFFDVYGNLRGYGTEKWGGNGSQNTLYEFNKETGEMYVVGKGKETWSSDGCACPYTVGLQMSVEPGAHCYSYDITLRIFHSGKDPVNHMTLELPLPKEFTITKLSNTAGGVIKSGLNTNYLRMEHVFISKGSKYVKIEVTVPYDTGSYDLQAKLSGLPYYLGEQILSDNADSYEEGDPYTLVLKPPHVSRTESYRICEGQHIDLTSFYNGRLYEWTNGHQDTILQVRETGHYIARIAHTCDTASIDYLVEVNDVNVTVLPGDKEAKPFEILTIEGEVQYIGSGYLKYQWTSSSGKITCDRCPGPFNIIYNQPDTISLKVVNDIGCADSDRMEVSIDYFIAGEFFIPNAFSPNGDLLNDTFYVVGYGYLIRNMGIYDRWGSKVFDITEKPSGFPEYGWDGSSNHKGGMSSNVYFYSGTLEDEDGRLKHVSGTVTVVR